MGEILQLLYPERCVGCSGSSGLLCKQCSREWSRPIHNRIENIPLVSSAYYSRSISHIVLRAKENNDSRARRVLANSIATFIENESIVIPIPSSKSSNRRRGYDHALLLAREVARLCESTVWNGLYVTRRVKDQTALSHAQRFTNLSGSYALSQQIIGNAPSQKIVLIDDLVTTGASLREALRVLRGAEIAPKAAISACIATHHLPNTIST